MGDHYANTLQTGRMQDVVEIVRTERGTVNAFSAARHSGKRAYLTAREWSHAEGGVCRIVKGRHRGARRFVSGFELVCGSGYVATFASAHKAGDLFAWACINGHVVDVQGFRCNPR